MIHRRSCCSAWVWAALLGFAYHCSGAAPKSEPQPERRCFTHASDFFPGALHGSWSGITTGEWEVEEAAGRRRKYGNMTCSFEEEDKACGRQVGMWTSLTSRGVLDRATENAAYAQEHMLVRPQRCHLGPFDAKALVKMLAGGRTLKIQGDSTMRQLFGALICSIPLSLVAQTGFVPHKGGE